MKAPICRPNSLGVSSYPGRHKILTSTSSLNAYYMSQPLIVPLNQRNIASFQTSKDDLSLLIPFIGSDRLGAEMCIRKNQSFRPVFHLSLFFLGPKTKPFLPSLTEALPRFQDRMRDDSPGYDLGNFCFGGYDHTDPTMQPSKGPDLARHAGPEPVPGFQRTGLDARDPNSLIHMKLDMEVLRIDPLSCIVNYSLVIHT
ncbi:hypothetical protein CISG_01013 [Coccidioides immitis RMSCC 3703]|uniref:Uncharacterized protein n=2 Tax=Coccidioides immitis TaxID=5501 RepID=A0A0J8QY25_COCIT|nr:hypothetical protein CIRG_01879 [Coccidioides immitis RMSCC 2394]KMU76278.1 hypothetical protein CISG_01013 [Coccidioides immitis RMSCC 3703]